MVAKASQSSSPCTCSGFHAGRRCEYHRRVDRVQERLRRVTELPASLPRYRLEELAQELVEIVEGTRGRGD